MGAPIELVPLLCIKCQAPLPAEPDEIAWVCTRCGQGMLLDEGRGLQPLNVQYAAGIPPEAVGRPYWVADGQVSLQRELYSGNKTAEAQMMWSQPRRFTIPAYNCPMETLLQTGPKLLLTPPALQPGSAVRFQPVTLSPGDIQSLAEFIVVAIEAERSDMLKQIVVSVKMSEPTLWIFP
ncbi:MAG: hypothetical protein A2Z49_04305 [Chloroflexi bacterium RBG_19FT_COMBO_56_12]|nr:MAG: hypothetical protein A2Z49_04305 [Chloroflexi bacterium RBG_19FT_COMBO_56_12]